MIDSINSKAYQLIGLLSTKPKEKIDSSAEPMGSSKERGVIDWSGKLVKVEAIRTTDYSGNTLDIFYPTENGRIGLDESTYPRFRELLNEILSIEKFGKVLSVAFVESESFKWMIGVHQNQKAKSSLYDYLLTSMETNIRPITFYFPVFNLEIETPFKIGNVEFVYFTKDYLDDVYETYKDRDETLTEEQFKKLYRKEFQGQVLAKVTVRSERYKAEEIAKDEAEISVDILKIFGDAVKVPEKKTMFDLNYRLGYQVQSNYLVQEPNEKNNIQLNLKFNNVPLNFTHQRSSTAFQCGLTVFSDYAIHTDRNELDELIIQGIHLFGSAISNWDLHVRCVNLITILESIFIGADEKWGMEKKVGERLTRLFSYQGMDKEGIISMLGHIYQVRHKMIHKAVRIDINLKLLSEVQRLIVNLFLRLIQHYRNTVPTKADLIENMGEPQT